MNFAAISRLKRPLKVRFYSEDNFPVTFDCVERKLSCIGMCTSCPIYKQYGKIGCREEIFEFVRDNIPLPEGYTVSGKYEEVIKAEFKR